jgi:hypothetical protein
VRVSACLCVCVCVFGTICASCTVTRGTCNTCAFSAPTFYTQKLVEHAGEVVDFVRRQYNNRPLITPPGIRPSSMPLYTVLGIRPHREIQHQIYINNSILVCHPPQRKYTMPELKRLLLSSLATNHALRLL